jgi:cytochrome d ubiquinol oxidase subunit I
MVGLGCLFILFFAVTLFLLYKKDITAGKWWKWTAILLLPLGYIASESGWLVAEFGRQPWTIQDMLPVSASVSDISAGSVALTFFIFLALFTTMLVVELNIMFKQIRKGPESESLTV